VWNGNRWHNGRRGTYHVDVGERAGADARSDDERTDAPPLLARPVTHALVVV
jgi:hypothetical protein